MTFLKTITYTTGKSAIDFIIFVTGLFYQPFFFAQFNCVLQNICGFVVRFIGLKNVNTTKWDIMGKSITKDKVENRNGCMRGKKIYKNLAT